MMKITVSCVLFMMLMSPTLVRAHLLDYYSFSQASQPYMHITGTNLPECVGAGVSGLINLGFTFPYGSQQYSQIRVSSSGWVNPGGNLTQPYIPSLNSASVHNFITPLTDYFSYHGTVEYLLEGTAPQRFITVQYSGIGWGFNAALHICEFQVRLFETGDIEFHYGHSTGYPKGPSGGIGMNLQEGDANPEFSFISITPGSPATASSASANDYVSDYPGENTLYRFWVNPGAEHDLKALAVTGNPTGYQGTGTPAVVTVRNVGTQPATDYQVLLLEGDTVVDSLAGQPLQPQQTQVFSFDWQPLHYGLRHVYARVQCPADTNPQNDTALPLGSQILPPDSLVYTMGAGDLEDYLPVNFYYHFSLYETLYYPQELQSLGITEGWLFGISFYSIFGGNLSGIPMPVSFWLGGTELDNLDNGWIPFDRMTRVYNGLIDLIPAGPNRLFIPLQTPYYYGGGNLVLLAKQFWDTSVYTSQLKFKCQTTEVNPTNRSRRYQSDTTDSDPATPPTGTVTGRFPKTTFSFTSTGTVNNEDTHPAAIPCLCQPNPFRERLSIHYYLKEAAPVSISIYNTKGQLVKRLMHQTKSAGQQQAEWDARNDYGLTVSGGIYLVRLESQGRISVSKTVLLR